MNALLRMKLPSACCDALILIWFLNGDNEHKNMMIDATYIQLKPVEAT